MGEAALGLEKSSRTGYSFGCDMAWLPFSLYLLGTRLCGAASKQDLVLDQPPVVRALRGESVTLPCSCDVCNYPDFHSEWRFTSGNRGPGTILAVKTALNSKHQDPPYKFSVTHQRNSRSLLLIKNLQINDQGTYMCTMIKNVPPPTVILKGPGTQLEVYVLPKVWLFASPSEAAFPMALVTCAVRDFYPQSLYATLNATCGVYDALADNASALMTDDGTFNMTLQAWVNVTDCQNGTEVTCLVRQLTAETRRILWIPRAKNKVLLPVPIILIRFLFGGAVVLWLMFLVGCFMKTGLPGPAVALSSLHTTSQPVDPQAGGGGADVPELE
ncbi:uncharacterized protein LOC117873895 isoform X2 [Trachemys scripta elegans]|uniref:uncharacterized protein LOC117873895 isoform X2 n=1 Tax=Trachemys scripta elegans TaxID=31138 RepID=UPI001551EBBC|nr:uncharacterized protein LOC117873895 isoform X2 [Trachemys scripta elegans]